MEMQSDSQRDRRQEDSCIIIHSLLSLEEELDKDNKSNENNNNNNNKEGQEGEEYIIPTTASMSSLPYELKPKRVKGFFSKFPRAHFSVQHVASDDDNVRQQSLSSSHAESVVNKRRINFTDLSERCNSTGKSTDMALKTQSDVAKTVEEVLPTSRPSSTAAVNVKVEGVTPTKSLHQNSHTCSTSNLEVLEIPACFSFSLRSSSGREVLLKEKNSADIKPHDGKDTERKRRKDKRNGRKRPPKSDTHSCGSVSFIAACCDDAFERSSSPLTSLLELNHSRTLRPSQKGSGTGGMYSHESIKWGRNSDGDDNNNNDNNIIFSRSKKALGGIPLHDKNGSMVSSSESELIARTCWMNDVSFLCDSRSRHLASEPWSSRIRGTANVNGRELTPTWKEPRKKKEKKECSNWAKNFMRKVSIHDAKKDDNNNNNNNSNGNTTHSVGGTKEHSDKKRSDDEDNHHHRSRLSRVFHIFSKKEEKMRPPPLSVVPLQSCSNTSAIVRYNANSFKSVMTSSQQSSRNSRFSKTCDTPSFSEHAEGVDLLSRARKNNGCNNSKTCTDRSSCGSGTHRGSLSTSVVGMNVSTPVRNFSPLIPFNITYSNNSVMDDMD